MSTTIPTAPPTTATTGNVDVDGVTCGAAIVVAVGAHVDDDDDVVGGDAALVTDVDVVDGIANVNNVVAVVVIVVVLRPKVRE